MPLVTTRSEDEPRLSRPVRVAEAIKNWVVDKGLKAGDRLPSEPEMIEQFGMAKSTIREAMRILEAQGLVRTRTGPGGGSFVHEVSTQRARALLGNYFYFKDLTIADIYELRCTLEPQLAASLAGKLPDEVLIKLESIVARYPKPASSADEEREQHIASLQFHALLAKQSKNKLLGFLIDFMTNMLADLTVYRKLYNPPNVELWQRGRDYQVQLIKALREGLSGEAYQIMADHMTTAQTLMSLQEAEIQKRFI
ncbi:FCD domain-containing protein [Kiloniella laminariae]|uniref:FCD domain-containing protein n=1 Tax=Kiloniella laminariae TaxID=454162 RepID=A0ABT4LKA4_9PROT|nr:FCD domain-containing protein [Kiloniella laminariae]MCZ4281507.1 FCD domain-containing protein [Kiloniella laminariae]